jgi:LEA14-like dessication related protein
MLDPSLPPLIGDSIALVQQSGATGAVPRMHILISLLDPDRNDDTTNPQQRRRSAAEPRPLRRAGPRALAGAATGRPAPDRPPSRVTAMTWLAALLILAVGLAAAAAVSLTRRLVPPDVKLRWLRPERLGAGEQTFRVGLRIDNPNPLPLPVQAMTYRLWLEEREIAAGEGRFQRRVPARGTADIEVLVSGNASHLARTLPRLALIPRPWRYRIEGTVTVLPPLSVGYRHQGHIDLKGMLRLAASLR